MKGFIWILNIIMVIGLVVFFLAISTERPPKFDPHTPNPNTVTETNINSLGNIGELRWIGDESLYKMIVDKNIFSKERKPSELKSEEDDGSRQKEGAGIIFKKKTTPTNSRDLKYITHFPNEDPPVAFFEKNRDDGFDGTHIISVIEGKEIRGWRVKSILDPSGQVWMREGCFRVLR